MTLCACGCGNPAPIAKRTDNTRGTVKGVPLKFIRGHVGKDRRPLHVRFWSNIKLGSLPHAEAARLYPEIAEEPCWEWCGDINRYGRISLENGERHRTHRVSWFLTHGVWPEKSILHKCDNGACVRPSHLMEGTQQENMADMVAKGRNFIPAGWGCARTK